MEFWHVAHCIAFFYDPIENKTFLPHLKDENITFTREFDKIEHSI